MKIKTKLFLLLWGLILIDQIFKVYFPTSFCNKNLAWGIPVSGGIFYFIWMVIVVILLYIFTKTKNNYRKIFLILIFSGAISNLIDRFYFGCVVDYISLKYFPVFNLGDIYITTGIILLAIDAYLNHNNQAPIIK